MQQHTRSAQNSTVQQAHHKTQTSRSTCLWSAPSRNTTALLVGRPEFSSCRATSRLLMPVTSAREEGSGCQSVHDRGDRDT